MKRLSLIMAIVCSLFIFASEPGFANTSAIADAGFESGTLAGWNKGNQTSGLSGSSITQSGSGVSVISQPVTFNAGAHPAAGNPTLSDGSPNPYYAPAVAPTAWTFSPFGSHAAVLQPKSEATFSVATAALGLSTAEDTAIRAVMSQQATASTYGSGNPTDASWITREVTLEAGTTYTMSWNYIGTDYVPFNDGSITSLTYAGSGSPIITVNNSVQRYALLGFTNPGTGDYSTGTFGSTGWQISTYQVSVTGTYLLGFAVFNLDDTGLSPALLVDSQPGSTQKNGTTFGAVPPNNSNAPVVTTAPATTTEAPTTTSPSTTTEAPTTTDAPTTTSEPPSTEPQPVTTEPLATVTTLPTVDAIVALPTTGGRPGPLMLIAFAFIWIGMIASWSFSERRRNEENS